jgi:CRISPR/Cas system CSM-associated protein Csm4 (group 5 of RAMP superfamily)
MKKILLKKAISSHLFLRQTAVNFFKKINKLKDSEIIIDFKGIQFMSRSFAHEYLQQTAKSKKNIKELNVPTDIKKMLNYVQHAQAKPIIITSREKVEIVALS